MLEQMTNLEIIEFVRENPDATEVERDMAERLCFAVDELDHLTQTIHTLEAANGNNARG